MFSKTQQAFQEISKQLRLSPKRQLAKFRRKPDGKEFLLFIEDGKLFFKSPIPFEFFGGTIQSIQSSGSNLIIKYLQLDYPSDSIVPGLRTMDADEILFL